MTAPANRWRRRRPPTFLRLVARMVAEGFAPVPLLSVLKHPLCAGGMARDEWLAAARALERLALRGPRPAPGLAGLRASVARGEAMRRPSVAALLDALEAALAGFDALPDAPVAPARGPARRAYGGGRGAGRHARPARRPAPVCRRGRRAAGAPPRTRWPPRCRTCRRSRPPTGPTCSRRALAGPVAPSLRASRGRGAAAHPRIAILGLLEARLQSFDRVVLGALEESVWPQATEPGPVDEPPDARARSACRKPEARIGRVAADFLFAAASAPEAVLSSALRARRGADACRRAGWCGWIPSWPGRAGWRCAASPAAGWAAALDAPAVVAPCAAPRARRRPPRCGRAG